MPVAEALRVRSSLSRSAVDSLISAIAASEPPTIGGASVFENRYGRERLRSRSTISRLPDVNPPDAPPSALPSVDVNTSTRCMQPRILALPRPVVPTNPVAWLSSTMTSAPYFSARSQIASTRAMSPSIENTPSVAIMRSRLPGVALSLASRSFRSSCS